MALDDTIEGNAFIDATALLLANGYTQTAPGIFTKGLYTIEFAEDDSSTARKIQSVNGVDQLLATIRLEELGQPDLLATL